MNEREVERRLRTALEHAAPDDLEAVRARCGPQHSGDVIPMPKRKRPMRRAAPWLAAACLLLVIAGGVMGVRYQKASAVASLVSLDVNPSVLLEVNGAEKVLSAQPINDDAGEILDGMDLRGTDLNVAINAIVGSLLKHGYVDELANSVLVSVEDSDADRGAALEAVSYTHLDVYKRQSFAMANATEEAKAAARYVTGTNHEAGVGMAVEQYLLNG